MTNSGFERLSRDFNRWYTKAIQDIMKVFEYVNDDLNYHRVRMNYRMVEKILDCFLKNREKFRDDIGTGTGFIRVVKDEKGKWNNVEYYDRRENRKEVINFFVDLLEKELGE